MANSLDQIKKLLKTPQKPYTEYPTCEHSVLGKVHVGKMSTRGYCELEAFSHPTPDVAKWPQADIIRWMQEGQMRVLFKNCVYLNDGTRLDDEVVTLLLKGNYGEDNQKLLNECRKQNPPREYMVEEVFVSLQFNAWTVAMLNAAVKGGLMREVNKYLSGKSDDPDVKAAAETLAELEDVLPTWLALFKIEDAEKLNELKNVSDQSAEKTATAVGSVIASSLS